MPWYSARRLMRSCGRSRADTSLVTNCKTLAALRASPFQHDTAVFRAHADQKAVRALPPARIGLKRSLPLHLLPAGAFLKVIELTMLANAFQECQTRGECATVCVLSRELTGLFRPCAFGLFPKFSTPVEKAVEIP